MTRTIDTTAEEDAAIAYAHAQSQLPPGTIPQPLPVTVAPPPMPLTAPPDETEAAFFDRMTHSGTVGPMMMRYQSAALSGLVLGLRSIGPEQRAAARAAIEAVITQYGGTVPT
jgi:hypothetical protein